MKRYTLPLLALTVLSLVTCQQDVPTFSGSLFPANVGNIWNYYAIINGDENCTATLEVVGTAKHSLGFQTKNVKLTYHTSTLDTIYNWYSYEDVTGLYWYKSLNSEDCLVLAKYPFAVGDSWDFTYEGDSYTGYVDSIVTVVALGETSYEHCYKIYYNSTNTNFFVWWKEGIGQIGQDYQDEGHSYYRILQNYTLVP
jgi:hypothetical protein